MSYLYIGLFAVGGALMVLGIVLASRLVAPSRPSPAKATPYECGERSIGQAWTRFNVGYFLFALIFLIFDVETVFLYPCAMVLKSIGVPALIEIGLFVGVLMLGLVYAWRKGVLEWR